MKEFAVIAAAVAIVAATCAPVVIAGIPITKVDKIDPTEEIYMDMACTAASKSVASKGKPCGAVVILNRAWKGSGTATADATAEQNAIAASRLPDLELADVYTICEPTTEAYNDMCRMGAQNCYFVIPRDVVVAKGIYPAEAYDDSKIDPSLTPVPLKQMDFPEAQKLIK